MDVRLIAVPYDSAHHDARMGAGPGHLLRAGLRERLARAGHGADVVELRLAPGAFTTEVAAAFELQRLVAGAVREAVAASRLPVVLAGNCNTAVGTVAGLGPAAREVVWLDAHGDFNTPETTVSGFLDGMAVAMLTGRCWRRMTAAVGLDPVAEEAVHLVGARDLDPFEGDALAASAVRRLPTGNAASLLADALGPRRGARDGGGGDGEGVYLHLDLDVLDPGTAVVNGYPAPGGLDREGVEAVVRVVGERRRLAAFAVTAFDPALDRDGRTTELVLGLVEAGVEAAC